jgi:hypothetical protein
MKERRNAGALPSLLMAPCTSRPWSVATDPKCASARLFFVSFICIFFVPFFLVLDKTRIYSCTIPICRTRIEHAHNNLAPLAPTTAALLGLLGSAVPFASVDEFLRAL